MKWVFVDTDNGGTPSNVTPDTGTSIYHTSATWPANGARWSSIGAAVGNATVQGITDDLVIFCQGVADHTTVFTVSNSLTCASLLIEGDVVSPIWDDNKYTVRFTGTSQAMTTVNYQGPTTIRGIQFYHEGTNSAPWALNCAPLAGTAPYTVDSCYIRIRGTGTGLGIALRLTSSTGHIMQAFNTVVQAISGFGGTRTGVLYGGGANITGELYNCVVEGFTTGVQTADTAKNNAVFNCDDDFSTLGSGDYNASDDGDGTNAVTGLTWGNQFEDYASGDFRLKSASSLIGAGLDDPASGAFADDIAGTTRSDWDIGAFEWVASGSTLFLSPLPQRNYRKSGRY